MGAWKSGPKAVRRLDRFLSDDDRDVILHAIAAFGSETSQTVMGQLVAHLDSGDAKLAVAASEALRLLGSDIVLKQVMAAAKAAKVAPGWILAILGRLPADKVRAALKGDALLVQLEPLLFLSSSSNWLTADTVDIDLKFLIKQNFVEMLVRLTLRPASR
jgi:hypothetical protein